MMGKNSQRVWWFGLGLWVLGSLVLLDTIYAQSEVSFLARKVFQVGRSGHFSPIYVTVGDFNGDGRLDLATANEGGNSVSILLAQGDGTFSEAQVFGTGLFPNSITMGDFNGDGQPDLATANGGGATACRSCLARAMAPSARPRNLARAVLARLR
jgi:hypothetical protein